MINHNDDKADDGKADDDSLRKGQPTYVIHYRRANANQNSLEEARTLLEQADRNRSGSNFLTIYAVKVKRRLKHEYFTFLFAGEWLSKS